jgi:uncharacterized protein (DUF488 family)
MKTKIYTIGHSTHSFDEFINILHAYEIELVVDVRTIPGSRHNPQFNAPELERDLRGRNIGYAHLKQLGGLRRTTKASVNTGWENSSFRGFADYMQTADFRTGVDALIDLAQGKRTVIMCAEAVPWRCHRSLIADALLARNFDVEDIISQKTSKPHRMTSWARVEGISITYPRSEQEADGN